MKKLSHGEIPQLLRVGAGFKSRHLDFRAWVLSPQATQLPLFTDSPQPALA